MTKKEIRKQIRETKKEMKARGIKRISFMNGGLTPMEYTFNSLLFNLSVQLEKAKD